MDMGIENILLFFFKIMIIPLSYVNTDINGIFNVST